MKKFELRPTDMKLPSELENVPSSMKTIIEDLVAKMEGKPETELPKGTTIRFEIGNTRLSCKATDEGVEIYKINDMGKEESRIMTVGASSNKLYVR